MATQVIDSSLPFVSPRGETVRTAQVQEFFSSAWFSKMKLIWRSLIKESRAGGRWPYTEGDPVVSLRPFLKDTVEGISTILVLSCSGDTGLKALKETGEPSAAESNSAPLSSSYPLISCSHGKIVVQVQVPYPSHNSPPTGVPFQNVWDL